MALNVRVAARSDVEAVLDLIEQLFDPPGGLPAHYQREDGRERTLACLESATSDVLLAETADGTPLGLATVYVDVLSIRQGRRCWVEEMIVDVNRRSAGVGGRLLEAAHQWASEMGCTHVQLHSGLGREDAHRFYEGQGMNRVAYVFHRELSGAQG